MTQYRSVTDRRADGQNCCNSIALASHIQANHKNIIMMMMMINCSVYQSPLYESLLFDLIVERMLAIGYPLSIKEYKYDPSFPVR